MIQYKQMIDLYETNAIIFFLNDLLMFMPYKIMGVEFATINKNHLNLSYYINSPECDLRLCCMKGEKVSTPLDKDGRGPWGLQHTYG